MLSIIHKANIKRYNYGFLVKQLLSKQLVEFEAGFVFVTFSRTKGSTE